jgi:hypothetical protein
MVSIKVLGKLVVEPKTLGWEHSLGKVSKIVFENLGVVPTPLKSFQRVLETWSWTWELKELVVL